MSTPTLAAGPTSPGKSGPAPAPSWRWLWLLLLTIAVVITLGAAAHLLQAHRMARELKARTAALDREDPSWRLVDQEWARAVVPEGDNSAPVVVLCASELRKSSPLDKLYQRLGEVPPEEQLSDDVMASLGNALDERKTSVAEGRRLAGLPRGRHRIEYTANPLSSPRDSFDAHPATQLLYLDAFRLAQAGDLRAALRSCRACLNAGRSVGDEPFCSS